MKHTLPLAAAAVVVAALALAGCIASAPPLNSAELDAQAQAMMRSSFRAEGIVTLERLQQDAVQRACSTDQALPEATAKQIEADALATVRWPSNGQYLGDWREGEKLAQNGRGMTFTDASDKPAANGGSCYNCHQLDKAEISFGTIGPSLYNFGKLRGVTDPNAPEAAATVQYAWGKLWNSKAYSACSNMPRFGHNRLLDEQQIRHLMALLLDPKSPVNQ